ncbi:hypothetical protein [Microbacterium sp. PMB16]|uniref:hypothetical protein n=1 Tax=Microbacterium sp. PMB16 TaxID=3120157 RepID=UPI003F4C5D98
MDVIGWLLDSDPAIRWQVQRDLLAAPADVVAAERARVAHEGWGGALLALQDPDGRWDGGTYRPGWVDEERPFFDAWTATHFSLQQLMEFGLDPQSPEARDAVAKVRAGVRWEHAGQPYFDGEVEPCINGVALAIAAYFGEGGDPIVDTILTGRLPDGGWNCWTDYGATVSSFHSTLCVIEGLLAWEAAGGESAAVSTARRAGEDYLLERQLFLRRSTGEIVDPRYTMLSYPVRWYYDVLRALEYFRVADRRDERLTAAIELLRSKQTEDGRWRRDLHHEGPQLVDVSHSEGMPSRWVTLRALRVLRWWDAE